MTGQNLAQQKHPVTTFLPAQHAKPQKQGSPTFPTNENQHGQKQHVNNGRDFGNVLPTVANYKPLVILCACRGNVLKNLDFLGLLSFRF